MRLAMAALTAALAVTSAARANVLVDITAFDSLPTGDSYTLDFKFVTASPRPSDFIATSFYSESVNATGVFAGLTVFFAGYELNTTGCGTSGATNAVCYQFLLAGQTQPIGILSGLLATANPNMFTNNLGTTLTFSATDLPVTSTVPEPRAAVLLIPALAGLGLPRLRRGLAGVAGGRITASG